MRGSASLVVVTDRPPGAFAPGSGMPDEPALVALQAVAARARGVWVCRAGEEGASVPLRRHTVDHPQAAAHDAGHAQAVWPLYHDAVPSRYDPAWRSAIRAVSNVYATAAAAEAAFGATIFLCGHTLQLVPAILRRRRPDLRIGFYLPTHFPAAPCLRSLPLYRELLRGLLGADLLGFQTPYAAENFLRRMQELKEHEASHHADPPAPPSHPSVGVFPTSAQTPAIAALAPTPGVASAATALRRRLGDPRTVVLSIDEPHPSVEARLLALGDAFAAGLLDAASTAVVQVVLGHPADGGDGDGGIPAVVRSVNERLGRTVAHCIVDTPVLADRVALYRAADVLLAGARREGATTVALEFAAAARDDAALVLGELSGTAAVLPGAYLVGPRDPDALVARLRDALSATVPQQRMARMRAAVTAYHTYGWAEAFLRTLRATPRRQARSAAAPALHPVVARQRVHLGG